MITIYYIYQALNGVWCEDYIIFYDRVKALRFLYGTAHKYIIQGWKCERDEDNDYLNYKWNRKDV